MRFRPKPQRPFSAPRKLREQKGPALSAGTPLEAFFRSLFRASDTQERECLYPLAQSSAMGRTSGQAIDAVIPGATHQGGWEIAPSRSSVDDLDRARASPSLEARGVTGDTQHVVLHDFTGSSTTASAASAPLGQTWATSGRLPTCP